MIPRIPLCLLEQPAREAEEWCLALLVLVPPIFSMVFAGGVVWVIVLVTEAVTKSAQ